MVNLGDKSQIFPDIKVVNLGVKSQIFPEIKMVNLGGNCFIAKLPIYTISCTRCSKI